MSWSDEKVTPGRPYRFSLGHSDCAVSHVRDGAESRSSLYGQQALACPGSFMNRLVSEVSPPTRTPTGQSEIELARLRENRLKGLGSIYVPLGFTSGEVTAQHMFGANRSGYP